MSKSSPSSNATLDRRQAPALHEALSPWRAGEAARLRRVGLVAIAAHVPPAVLRNCDFEGLVETSDEWIVTRTGIRERHRAAPGEAASDLGARAALEALARAGVAAGDVELIIVATSTPDSPVPATVCHLQRKLEATRAVGFDLAAGCSGFVFALMTAHRLLAAGAYRNALVVSAEVMTSITDYSARETCVLFGDGAGAAFLEAGERGHEMVDHLLGMDGNGADSIRVDAGGSRRPASHETVREHLHYLTMEGRDVFRFAVTALPAVVRGVLERNGLTPADVRLFVAHQANLRILEAAARALEVDMERFVINIERFGNTSSASVPIALDQVETEGRLSSGDWVVLAAFGSGLAWGASLIRW